MPTDGVSVGRMRLLAPLLISALLLCAGCGSPDCPGTECPAGDAGSPSESGDAGLRPDGNDAGDAGPPSDPGDAGDAGHSSDGGTISGDLLWAGLHWKVRNSTGGPGPNVFDARNVSLDDAGNLHLRIENRDGGWTTAELGTDERLGWGDYTWFVSGPLDTLDPNVVLGLFTYPTADVGPDTTNEIDIEIARWGNPTRDPLDYTVWPATEIAGYRNGATHWPMTLNGSSTTHSFHWAPDEVAFQSTHGFYADGGGSKIASWTFAPEDAGVLVPQAPVPVHLNLWLYGGAAPTNDAGVEIVLRKFIHPEP